MNQSLTLLVNGQTRTVLTPPERSLLEVLREDLGLTGTKYGCGEGQCGACTVLVNGQSLRACLTPVGSVAGQKIETIEGLAHGDVLHPVQEAFLAEDAFQCGYCTPGMILEVVGLLRDRPQPAEADIRSRMEGHLCRCCGYPNLLLAIRRAAASTRPAQP